MVAELQGALKAKPDAYFSAVAALFGIPNGTFSSFAHEFVD